MDATAELATTLRQQSKVHDVQALLDRLDAISMEPDAATSITAPAAAHRLYGLGRLDEHRIDHLADRAQYLGDSARRYSRLAEAPGWVHRAEDWREREAWSLMGLAINLRLQSRFEGALTNAAAAARLFEQLGDPYGRSHGLFSIGFSLRLLGHDDTARDTLQKKRTSSPATTRSNACAPTSCCRWGRSASARTR